MAVPRVAQRYNTWPCGVLQQHLHPASCQLATILTTLRAKASPFHTPAQIPRRFGFEPAPVQTMASTTDLLLSLKETTGEIQPLLQTLNQEN